jgi:hypothetical protein
MADALSVDHVAALPVDQAISEALSYGGAKQLNARHRRWVVMEAFYLYFLPAVIMLLGNTLVFAAPTIWGKRLFAETTLLSVLFCVTPFLAYLSVWVGTNYRKGFWCAPIGDYIKTYNMVYLLDSPGVRQLRDAILASGRELYWVDVWLMEKVLKHEIDKGLWKPESLCRQLVASEAPTE